MLVGFMGEWTAKDKLSRGLRNVRGTWNRAEFWHGTLIVTGAGCHYTYALYLFVTLDVCPVN